jgi:hypothetical protein
VKKNRGHRVLRMQNNHRCTGMSRTAGLVRASYISAVRVHPDPSEVEISVMRRSERRVNPFPPLVPLGALPSREPDCSSASPQPPSVKTLPSGSATAAKPSRGRERGVQLESVQRLVRWSKAIVLTDLACWPDASVAFC